MPIPKRSTAKDKLVRLDKRVEERLRQTARIVAHGNQKRALTEAVEVLYWLVRKRPEVYADFVQERLKGEVE